MVVQLQYPSFLKQSLILLEVYQYRSILAVKILIPRLPNVPFGYKNSSVSFASMKLMELIEGDNRAEL